MRRQETSREEVVAAAEKVAIHDFIMPLPKEYEIPVAELGANFSSGNGSVLVWQELF